MRTRRETVTFERPFSLRGVDGQLPPGTYAVDTDEERLEGLSFEAYRRCVTTIFLPTQPGGELGELIEIDPAELAAALKRDGSGRLPRHG